MGSMSMHDCRQRGTPASGRLLLTPASAGRLPQEVRVLPLLAMSLAVVAALPWLLPIPSALVAALLACFLAQCVYGAAHAVLSGHRLLSSVFWTISLCYLAMPAVYQVSTRQAAWKDSSLYLDQTRLLVTLLGTNLLFGCFALGAAGHRRRRRGGPATGPTSRSRALPARGLLVPAAYAVGALLLLPVVVAATGGVGALVSSRAQRNAALAAAGIGQNISGGVRVALVAILPGALALACTYILVVRRLRGGSRYLPGVLLVSSCLLLLYSNPLANTRFLSTAAFLPLLLLLLQPRSRRALAVLTTLLVIGVLAVYPLANAFRGPGAAAETASLADNDFDGFQQLVNTRQYVEEHGHTWGRHLGSAALFALPRSIWPAKAVPASIPVAANRGYSFTNLSLPLPGELYLEFGLFGAAGAMFAWGRGCRRLDEDWAEGIGSTPGALVPYLAAAQLGLLRGPVGAMVPIYGSTVILLTLALLAGRGVRRGRGAPSSGRLRPGPDAKAPRPARVGAPQLMGLRRRPASAERAAVR
jgi:hypothetical protein